MKLCIDCKHHQNRRSYYFDRCIKNTNAIMDPVTGEMDYDHAKTARDERRSWFFGCGINARYFEAKK